MKIQVGLDKGSYSFDASAKTITFSGLGTVNLEDILLITNITTSTVIYQFNSSEKGGSIASNVLTLNFDTTAMADTDDLQIFINIQDPVIDFDALSQRSSNLNAPQDAYTDTIPLSSAQDLTADWVDLGSEIPCAGYTTMNLFVVADVNDSQNAELKILAKDEIGGVDEYEIDGSAPKLLWSTSQSDFKKVYTIDVAGLEAIQLQVKAGVVGAIAGDITSNYRLVYGG